MFTSIYGKSRITAEVTRLNTCQDVWTQGDHKIPARSQQVVVIICQVSVLENIYDVLAARRYQDVIEGHRNKATNSMTTLQRTFCVDGHGRATALAQFRTEPRTTFEFLPLRTVLPRRPLVPIALSARCPRSNQSENLKSRAKPPKTRGIHGYSRRLPVIYAFYSGFLVCFFHHQTRIRSFSGKKPKESDAINDLINLSPSARL